MNFEIIITNFINPYIKCYVIIKNLKNSEKILTIIQILLVNSREFF